MLNNLILTFIFTLSVIAGFSQVDFNHYQTLLSKGPIPTDISMSTPEKIKLAYEINRPELEMRYRKAFYTSIYYSIDDILHSEICTFGDEVSIYVSEIAKKILFDDTKTYNELRFYTLKTNETNAFSTDQGIIFVTTGLISQITSEAQLAYVLAHEIAHYKRKHVLQRFLQKVNQKFSSIYEMSAYSKENELEADADGLKMYKNAGYSMELVTPAFDVLMYSYLPFDEEHIGYEFFNSKGFFIPKHVFPTEKFEITAEENYDDSKSSHPNISKRKGQVNKMMDKDPWTGGAVALLTEERFKYIQKIARHEVVRSAILIGDLTNALYSVRLLEKDDPNSVYLKRMEAKIWLTLAQCKAFGVTKPFESKKHKEGEIAVLHAMLRKFEKVELSTIALRQVYDIHANFPEDPELNSIYNLMVTTAANTKTFSLDRFSKYTYQEGMDRWNTIKDSIAKAPKDTSSSEQVTNAGSKYDRIKKKRNIDTKVDNSQFDSTLYYLYGMNDILSDSKFIEQFKSASVSTTLKSEEEADETEDETEQEIIEKSLLSTYKNSSETIVLGECNVATTDASESTAKIAHQIETNFKDLFYQAAALNGISLQTQNITDQKTVEGLNNFALIQSLLRQNSIYQRIEFSPVDFEYLKEMKATYQCNTAIIPNILYSNDAKSDKYEIFKPLIGLWYVPPAALIGVLAKLSISKNTYINFLEINLTTGKSSESSTYHLSGKPTSTRLGALLYKIL